MSRIPSLCIVLLCLASAAAAPAAEPVPPPSPAAPAPAPRAGGPAASAPAPSAAGPDRLELDPTSIRGNQELPKVLYIVPWKEPGLAEPAGRPLNSLIDEALAPVDREVFRRQVTYFDQLYPGSAVAPGDGTTAR